jgi:hypothetical protein
MNLRRAVFTLCVGGLVLSAASVCQAIIDTQLIEGVFKKTTFSQEDSQAIDEFMADAMQDLVGAVDLADVSKTRAIILKYKSNNQAEYVTRYAEAAYKQIEKGLAGAKESQDPAKRSRIAANLLILADAMKDPRFMDLAANAVAEKDPPVRYWAVRIAADPNLWAKLNQNQASAAQLTTKVLAAFNQVAASSTPDVMSLMSSFAGPINNPAADELLTKIADARIKQYSDWTVTYELADVTILRQLSDKIAAGSAAKSQLAKRFAQLYSFAIQRFMKGQMLGVLRDQSRDYLATVLIETEDKCLSKLLGASQGAIRKAVEANNDPKPLQAEHDRLFGGGGQPGVFPAKFSFTYGADGQSLPAPLPLLDPPTRQPAPPTTPAAPK